MATELVTKSFAAQCVAFPAKVDALLAEITTVSGANDLLSKASAMKHYATRLKAGVEVERPISLGVLKIKAKLGELMPAPSAKESGTTGGRGKKGDGQSNTLLHRTTVSAYRKVAANRERLEEYYESSNDVPSQEGFIQFISDGKKEDRKIRQAEKEAELAKAAGDCDEWTVTKKQDVVQCAAIITDPPYGILAEEWEPDDLESMTRDWLARWNECGADLILSFFSQRYMWDAKTWFDDCLVGYEFQQLLVWHYPNNKSPQSRKGFKQTWEPVFFYRKKGSDREIVVGGTEWGAGLNDFDCHVAAVPQSNFNDADRKVHPAQKPVSVMRWLVNAATLPGDMIVDPFCGSGTTGIASRQMGRRFHGIETDAGMAKTARRRIKAYGVQQS